MKYFYFILLILLVTFFFLFSNLNPDIIALDLFFVKIEGISLGFSMIFCSYWSCYFFNSSVTRLLRRNSKVLSDKMKILKPKQIIVALDFDSLEEVNSIVKLLDSEIYRLKIEPAMLQKVLKFWKF